jgi:predicted nucleotidyltransferase
MEIADIRKNFKDSTFRAIAEAVAEYLKTQPVVKAWIFGSYARGEEKPWSDVDILVELDKRKPVGLLKFVGIKNSLEDILDKNVDLVENGTLRQYVVESVNHDKQLIYERAQ